MFGAKNNADDVITRAHALLKAMEAQLSRRDFLVGGDATLADVAGYSDVSAAREGDVDLAAPARTCAPGLLKRSHLPHCGRCTACRIADN